MNPVQRGLQVCRPLAGTLGLWIAAALLPLAPSAHAEQACTWRQLFNPAGLNFAYPDLSSAYFTAFVPKPAPGQQIVIDGKVPEVRYWSFSSYDVSTAPYDTINDFEVSPADGSVSPFQGPALVDRSLPSGAPYRLTMQYVPLPDTRAPNILYARNPPDGGLTILIYRTYAPLAGLDADGGVGLPSIGILSNGVVTPMTPRDDCPSLQQQWIDATNRAARVQRRNELGRVDGSYSPPKLAILSDPPIFQVFYSLASLFGLSQSGLPAAPAPALEPGLGDGFFGTQSTVYALTPYTRGWGNVFIARGRAPVAVDSGTDAKPQLRYWSVCQYDAYLEAVVACSQDNKTVLDSEGFYTVVVADKPDRPAWATAANGYTWLPWGTAKTSMLIVRNMLPSPDFAQAYQNIPPGTDPYSVSGDYFPVGSYCSAKAVADAAGLSPKQAYARCASTRTSASARR